MRVEAAPIIIKAAHVLDGVSDRARDGLAVAVDGDRIVAVAPPAALAAKYPKATTIDLGTATLMPGLIDAHTHVFLDDDGPADPLADVTQLQHVSWVMKAGVVIR